MIQKLKTQFNKLPLGAEFIFLHLLLFFVAIGTTALCVSAIHWGQTQKARWDAMTEEEKAEEIKKEQDAYNANIHDYEIVGIFPYMHTITNNFGGIQSQEVLYNIIYINGEGMTSTDGTYSGSIQIGDADVYRVNDNAEEQGVSVILTKDTASKLAISKE